MFHSPRFLPLLSILRPSTAVLFTAAEICFIYMDSDCQLMAFTRLDLRKPDAMNFVSTF